MHIGGLALDGYLQGPRQRRPSPLARLGERPLILRHLVVGELTQDGVVPHALQMTPCPAALGLIANYEALEKELTEAEYRSLADGTAGLHPENSAEMR